ncbi:hypothetical protein [Streptomyces spirodelae]|uniref:Aromatic ring-opening dioxygenase LigA n=1 Tax=Streptomyces spirodelae TaxID=2812904 RepID=A0ABS3WYY5_9ACTN|nr:hypothetical protein [Streptomyces spirodelae]MBO8188342.1 hypothetical protein [Streptomyces spirodelae]
MERTKTVLAAAAVAACLPYLALKLIWVAGGNLGIPPGSPLREEGTALWLVNILTIAMDGTVVLLVLALTRPWGRRLPAALLALPLWIACGLLGPIVAAFPAQVLYGVLSGGAGQDSGADELLDGWVWTLVYSGFTVQALALGALFVRYVHDRWGALLRSPLHPDIAAPDRSPVLARLGFAAAVLLTLPCVAGLTTQMADQSADRRIVDAAFLLYTLVALAGVGRLLRTGGTGGTRGAVRRTAPRLGPTLSAAWIGSGVLACWGGWLLLGALTGGGRPLGQQMSTGTLLAYACQALLGLLLAAVGAQQLRHRARLLRHRPAPGGTVRQDA